MPLPVPHYDDGLFTERATLCCKIANDKRGLNWHRLQQTTSFFVLHSVNIVERNGDQRSSRCSIEREVNIRNWTRFFNPLYSTASLLLDAIQVAYF